MKASHKDQIDAALRLYQQRGEFDGRSVAQARQCLTRAKYTWSREVADYVKKKLAIAARAAGKKIVAARVTTYPDSGQTKVWIEWGDGSSTSGAPSSSHMQALIARAEREGVRVKYGLFGKER